MTKPHDEDAASANAMPLRTFGTTVLPRTFHPTPEQLGQTGWPAVVQQWEADDVVTYVDAAGNRVSIPETPLENYGLLPASLGQVEEFFTVRLALSDGVRGPTNAWTDLVTYVALRPLQFRPDGTIVLPVGVINAPRGLGVVPFTRSGARVPDPTPLVPVE